MRNSRRPFFYKEKKKVWPKVLMGFIIIAVFAFWASRVPQVRQSLGHYAIDTGSYLKSLFIPVHTPDPQVFRLPAPYPTLDLPPEEVVFAENLQQIAEANTPLEQEITPTETPGILWIIEEPEIAFDNDNLTRTDEQVPSVTIPEPVFERRDYQNDGPAALSALLRHLGLHESQYLISGVIKPNYFDPNVSFSELAAYIHEVHPEFIPLVRINGDEQLLAQLLQADLQVIIRIAVERGFPAWNGDDLWDSRYILLTGFDSSERVFYYIDPVKGNGQSMSFETLMALWYAFLREYMILVTPEQTPAVQQILNENFNESANLADALIKFQRDAEMVPDNVFTVLNAATILTEKEQYEEAWNLFHAARNTGFPQRYLLYNPAFYAAAFATGNADTLTSYAEYSLKINPFSEESQLWEGWGYLLKNENKIALESFQKALAIRPDYNEARYALRFLQSEPGN